MNGHIDAAKVKFFPPGIPILVIVIGIGLNSLFPLSFGIVIGVPARYFIGGAFAICAFVFLGVWAVVLFRKSGQSENPWKTTPCIESRGPFSITRNPMYLQMVLVCIGVAFATANWWIFLLTPVGAWVLQELAIKPEEKYLEEKFGDTFLEYKRKVRRWL
ncbi:MAG: isoprenylcysteine carboxylmethyltransferase family protein [Desulforhopalus sp.]|nr:isoprenylcysteine carboxylmethyltransferase family protein [Desulforhopalus sp.]